MAKKKRHHHSSHSPRHRDANDGHYGDRDRGSRAKDGHSVMHERGRVDNEMGHGSRYSHMNESSTPGMYHFHRHRDGERGRENSSPVPNTVRGLDAREPYSGYHESRRMMARDGAMIREDMSAPALLPRRVIEEYWPEGHNYNMGYVDDLFYGAQKQMHEDYDDLRREMKPGKY